MKKQYLLDMDGVLADFYTEASHRLNVALNKNITIDQYITYQTFHMENVWSIKGDEFWAIMERDDKFWSSLKPFPWAQKLVSWLSERGDVTICTSPNQEPLCAMQKMEWVKTYIPTLNIGKDVMIGSKKSLMAKPNNILIDDWDQNVNKFIVAGGNGILVPSNWNTPNLSLDKIIKTIEERENNY